MTAPTVTVRGVPAGAHLEDGFSTLIAFSLNPTIGFWEKTVQGSGDDGGDKVDQTTMHNKHYKTYSSRVLIDSTDGSIKVGYDPAQKAAIRAMINIPQSITEHYPDGSGEAFYGVLKSFIPDENSEGTMPEAKVMYYRTNRDPVLKTEEAPVFFASAGT